MIYMCCIVTRSEIIPALHKWAVLQSMDCMLQSMDYTLQSMDYTLHAEHGLHIAEHGLHIAEQYNTNSSHSQCHNSYEHLSVIDK